MVRLAPDKGRGRTVIQRMHVAIRGAVQGVGFRPFIHRLAVGMHLKGWVQNSSLGVFLEVEGEKSLLDSFLLRIEKEKPPISFIQSLEYSLLDPVFHEGFEIRPSEDTGEKSALILPDIATCSACLREIFDPADRRYRYPFTNCTHCGPRFTILEALPYDRPNTSMKAFAICPECRREYEDPEDRRFHAQPNACPQCGPRLELWDREGQTRAQDDNALLRAAEAILEGSIVAVKGLGGFHILADAANNRAVTALRNRKHREEKPFALMFPSLEAVRRECALSPLEERLLCSPEAPIVLLTKKPESASSAHAPAIAPAVAPRNPHLGVLLPYTPLHHLLMRAIGRPVIATSGNLSDEPICIDEREALARLGGIADLFLVHNRPIVRHMDDSIVRVILERELVLRRARGYAPLPLRVCGVIPEILAVGGHLKSTIAVSVEDNIFLSQHIGDLETRQSVEAFRSAIESFQRLYPVSPTWIATDMHPDYASTRYATERGTPIIAIQHHCAHVAACMAENEIEGSALGVSWDGTGYGQDGTVWGGEFIRSGPAGFTRIASFRRFRLPGSSPAVREPRRAALGLLYELLGESVFLKTNLAPIRAFNTSEIMVLHKMLTQGINAPWTSSVGRLFDAVASISGLRQRLRHEGQAAMELEFAAELEEDGRSYPFLIVECDPAGGDAESIVDWAPMIRAIIEDTERSVAPSTIADRFHNTLAEIIVAIARHCGEQRVVLTGGCFQNKILTERSVRKLEDAGFRPYWHQRIPPNDGGIALGQIVAASRMLREGSIEGVISNRGGSHVPGSSGKN